MLKTLLYSDDYGAELHKIHLQLKRSFKQALLEEFQLLSFEQEFGRNTAWLGEKGLNYQYTSRAHIATGWTKCTEALTKALHEKLGESFNHLLVNQYLPGQSLASHKDDEPELIGSIASLSFGDSATFNFTGGSLTLSDGDLLIGNRTFFNRLRHGVSKPHNNAIRYNLTWRTVGI